ncbi:MAG: 7TM diverse intracellular signaling domain-containing protein, partial [Desulfamplus sp.]
MRFYSSMPCCKYCKYFLYVAIFTSLLYPIIVSSSSTQTAQIESSNIIANPLSDSSQKFILEKSLKEKDIRQYLYYYIDETSKLDIEIISSDKFSSHFKPIGEKASFGYSRCSFWFRLTVKNPTAEPIKWFFEYPYAAVDHFIFYKPVSVVTDINSSSDINIFNPESTSNERDALTNRFTVIRSGDKYPFSERPVNFRTTVIPMNQTSGESTFYFNIVSDGAIVVPLVARSEQQMQTYMNADAVTNWMYYGVMIAAILYNFFIFVSIRELEYLYLILFIAGVSLLIMTQNGLSFQYLWSNNTWWANVCNPLFGTLSFLGLIPFTTLFLSTKKEFPRVHGLMTLLIYIGIVLLILIFIVPYHIATQCMVIFVGISCAIILVITTILSFRGQRQARFYIIACSSMLIVTLLLVLNLFGFIESNLWAYAGVYQIAISLLVTILSFGLVDKINLIRQDKAIALEEKQNALDMVKASEKQYRLLADNVKKEVIWTLDLKTLKISYITPSILSIMGYTPEEAKSQFSFKTMLTPESAKKAINAVKMGIASEEVSRQHLEENPPVELECYTKDGNIICTETTLTFLRDEKNRAFEMLGVSRDITERKRSEREKRRLEDQLTQSNKLEAIGTLAGGISHDMNNILTAIMGYVEISLSDVPADSKIHQRLERVLNACYRARDLVKQILTFSRQDSHENIPVNINIMVKEVLKLIRASLPATIKIEQNIPKDRSIIMADPTKIHQIIMNLCSNAGYAMQENGGLLNVSTEVMEIDSDSAGRYLQLAGGRYIRMTVSDTGHGMDKEVLNRIFEPFFTTKPQGKGTGMGLAMVHGIVKNLGGNIYVYSEVGQGTTFHLFFPCAPDGVDIQNLETPKLETGTETILYIDDEPPIVDMAYEMLTTLGYKVEGVVGSVEGLERFKQQPEKFDIVITDQTMPELTGCELAKKIWEIRPGLPIILCSGFNDLINPDSAKKLGISEYIMKPYSKHEISVKIRRALK